VRTHAAGLTAHLAETSHTLCTMLRLDLVDGTSLGFTDHDVDLTTSLIEGSLLYRSGQGLVASDVVSQVGLEVPNFELTLPLSEFVTLPSVTGKRFNRARACLFTVNWEDLTQGASQTLWGKVADQRIEGSAAVLEIRGLGEAYNQVVGQVTTLDCRVDFASAECGVTPTTFDTDITAVSSRIAFTVDVTGIPAIPFAYGHIEMTSGALQSPQTIELFSFNQATGVIELYVPLADLPEIGDQLTITNGCSKLKKHADATLPTCLFYENVVNFRGEDLQVGTDTYHKTPIPR
jgi:uncharacterized phage protein (TIGR02218 family)